MTDAVARLTTALAEIKTTAKLQHPHILPLLDSGSTVAQGQPGGLLYYVMPYVEGESLRDRLDREKQLPMDDAVRIAREIADALGVAHGHGIVHRDIKPENISAMPITPRRTDRVGAYSVDTRRTERTNK